MRLFHGIYYRLGEFVSLLSCLFNVIIGTGDRELTFSAGSWELKTNGSKRGEFFVRYIDKFWLTVARQQNHCYQSWLDHKDVFAKVAADRATFND